MATNEELEERVKALELENDRQELMAMYLMDAILELSRAAKTGSSTDTAHAVLAHESVKKALEILKSSAEYSRGNDGT